MPAGSCVEVSMVCEWRNPLRWMPSLQEGRGGGMQREVSSGDVKEVELAKRWQLFFEKPCHSVPSGPVITDAVVSLLCLCVLCTCFNSPMDLTEPSSVSTPSFPAILAAWVWAKIHTVEGEEGEERQGPGEGQGLAWSVWWWPVSFQVQAWVCWESFQGGSSRGTWTALTSDTFQIVFCFMDFLFFL